MAWEQLLDIYAEAADIVRDELTSPPLSCPNDGTLFQSGSLGERHCPFDGYEFPRDGRII